jgi:hypothetical protein
MERFVFLGGLRGFERRLPWSCLSSTLVDEPSAFSCVVFLLVLESAPDSAPKRLRFRPPWRSLHQYDNILHRSELRGDEGRLALLMPRGFE